MKSNKTNPPFGTVVKVEMSGNRYNAFDKDGNKLTSHIGTGTRKRRITLEWPWNAGKVKVVEYIGGKYQWRNLVSHLIY